MPTIRDLVPEERVTGGSDGLSLLGESDALFWDDVPIWED